MTNHFRSLNALITLCMILCLLAGPAVNTRQAVFGQEESPTPTVERTNIPTLDPSPTPEGTETPFPTELLTETPTDITPTITEEIPTETEPPEVVPLEISTMGTLIPDQYIVVYKDEVKDDQIVKDAVEDIKKNGGEVKQSFNAAFKGFAAKLPPGQLKKLRQDPRIAYIEADRIIHVSDDEISTESYKIAPTWGLDRIDQVDLPLNNEYFYPTIAGAGVNVYVIDTGIRTTHTDFGGRATLPFDNIGDSCTIGDCNGHGTHVAGIIGGNTYGVANKVSLIGVRVLDSTGSGSYSQVIAGINWVVANHVHPAVINMSLGGPADSALDAAVNAAINHGITVVVAAGNDNTNACNSSPARVPNAITVGATAQDDSRSYFSNYGSCLDMFAPGSGILSDSNAGNSATITMSGTSMAAPFVAGAAALYLSAHPSASAATVATDLTNKATKNHVTDPMGSANNLLFAPDKLTTAPVLISPANGSSLMGLPPYRLAWNPMTDVSTYELLVDNNSDFSSPIVDLTNGNFVSSTTFDITQNLAAGQYYWKVRARIATNFVGPWSAVFSFTVDPLPPAKPTLLSPANGAMVVGTPTFKWSSVIDAAGYTFIYGESADPSAYTYRSPLLNTTYHTPPLMTSMKTYYWWVMAQDAAGNVSDWSGPFTVTIVPPTPPAPVLDTPANGFLTNVNTPELKWKAANYAVSYEVQIATSYTFTTSLVQDYQGITDLSRVVDPLPDGKYYWRVRAMNANNVYSTWAAYRYFTVDTQAPSAPILSTPLNNASVVGTPTFAWKASSSAVRYQFAYGTSSDPLDGFVYQSAELTTTTHKPPIMQVMTPYFWFVRARDAAGNWSDWSTPPFTITSVPPVPAAPALDGPVSGFLTNNTTPELKWKTVNYAVSYELQVSATSTFTAPLVQDYQGITDLSRVVDPLPDGKYYWRVRAMNANNVYGAWAASRYFTVDTKAPLAPILSTPLNNASVVGTPTFAWKASSSAVRYQFAYGTSSDPLDGFVYQSAELTTTTHKPPIMQVMTPYFWFVRARDAAGNWSDWSTPPFTITSVPPVPAAPALDGPASGFLTNNTTPELKWKTVNYAVSYELQVSATSTFTTPLVQDYQGITDLSRVVDPLPDGKYYWRVRAMNVNNVYGAWAASRYFTVDTEAPLAPNPVSLADGASTTSTKPALSVSAASGAVRYRFQIAADNSFTSPVRDVTQAGTAYTTATPLDYGVYYWRVSAIDAAGNSSDWSAIRRFTITILKTPAHQGITNDPTPTFTWSAVTGALEYHLQVSTLADFSSPVINQSVTSTSFTPSIEIGINTFYWRVQVRTTAGWSAWMPAWQFTLIHPPVKNGTFEAGSSYWTEYSSHNYKLITNNFPVATHGGVYGAWLGGVNGEYSRLTQTGINMSGLRYLHFWYRISSSDYCGHYYDSAAVLVNSTPVKMYDLCSTNTTSGWVHQVIDLQNYTGSTISLEFFVATDSSFSSSFLLDDVTITNSSSTPLP